MVGGGGSSTVVGKDSETDTQRGVPVVVVAPPGAGKSAFLASVVQALAQKKIAVLPYFATAEGAPSVRGMLSTLTASALAAVGAPASSAAGIDVAVVRSRFARAVERARAKHGKCAVVVDCAEKVCGDEVEWIPLLPTISGRFCLSVEDGPAGVKLIAALKRRFGNVNIVNLTPLTTLERQAIVSTRLAALGKELSTAASNDQMALVVSKKDAGSPLYLHLVCEELRVSGTFGKLSDMLRALPPTIPQLYSQVLDRIETDFSKSDLAVTGGPSVLKNCLQLISCSSAGLHEDELLLALSPKFPDPLPRAVFGAVRQNLRELVGDSGAVLGESKSAVLLDIVQRKAKLSQKEAHKLLVKVFSHLCGAKTNFESSGDPVLCRRALTNLPFHLAGCEEWGLLRETICGLPYVNAMLSRGLLSEFADVIQLLQLRFSNMPRELTSALKELLAFCLRSHHVLLRQPQLLYQLAVCEPPQPPLFLAATKSKQSFNRLHLFPLRDRFASPQLLTLSPVSALPTAMSLSSDGRRLAVGFVSGAVCVLGCPPPSHVLWLAPAPPSETPVTCLAFGSFDRTIFAGYDDGSVRALDSGSGSKIFEIREAHRRRISGIATTVRATENAGSTPAANSAANLLITVGLDAKIKVWDQTNGKALNTVGGIKSLRPLSCVALADNGMALVCGDWDGRVWVRHSLSGQLLCSEHKHSASIQAISSFQNMVAASDNNGYVVVWKLQMVEEGAEHVWTLTETFSNQMHNASVTSLAWSRCGNFLVASSFDKTISVWDIRPSRVEWSVRIVDDQCEYTRFAGAILTGSVNVRPNTPTASSTLVAVSRDGNLCTVNLNDSKKTEYYRASQGPAVGVCVLDNHVFTAHASSPSNVIVWGSEQGQVVMSTRGRVTALAPGPRCVVAGDDLGHVSLAEVNTDADVTGSMISSNGSGHTAPVTCLSACTVSGECVVVSGSRDATLIVWRIVRRQLTRSQCLDTHRDWITCCAQRDKWMVSCGYDMRCVVWCWNGSGYDLHSEIPSGASAATAIAFSPSRGLLAIGSESNIRMFDEQLRPVYDMEHNHTSALLSLGFSGPDDTTVLSVSEHTATAHTLQSGSQIGLFVGHTQSVSEVTVLPSTPGAALTVASIGDNIRFWALAASQSADTQKQDTSTSSAFTTTTTNSPESTKDNTMGVDLEFSEPVSVSLLASSRTHSGLITNVAVSHNGAQVVSVCDAGEVCCWSLRPWSLLWQSKSRDPLRSCCYGRSIIAVGSDHGNVKVLGADGTSVVNAERHKGSVRAVSFLGDQKYVVSGGWDGVLAVTDIESLALSVELKVSTPAGVASQIEALSVSGTAGSTEIVACVVGDSWVFVASVATPRHPMWLARLCLLHFGRVRSLAVTKHTLTNRTHTLQVVLASHQSELVSCGVSIDTDAGAQFGSPNGMVDVKYPDNNVVDGLKVTCGGVVLQAHAAAITAMAAHDDHVVTVGRDGYIKVWSHSSTGEMQSATELAVGTVCQAVAVCGGNNGTVAVCGDVLGALHPFHIRL